jgi:PAS domain S-box-containing protein
MVKNIPEDAYKDIFNNTPAAILVMDIDTPNYTILDVNDAYLTATNSTREALMGKSVFAAFPANPSDEESKNIERAIFSFEQAIQTKKPHTMSNYRYDIPIRGTNEFAERYWTTTNRPILDRKGNVKYFIHSPEDVTELYKLRQREQAGIEALQSQREQLYSTFMQAPVGIAIFRGAEYIVDLINPPLCELYGQAAEEMLGKPVFEMLTHARGIGFERLLDNVRLTGESFRGQGLGVPLMRGGKLETVYLNLVCEPFREIDGFISGVIVVAAEITEQINAKLQIEEAEERARLAVDAVGMGTFDLNLATGEMMTSKKFANIVGFESQVSRAEYVKVIHPDDLEQRALALKIALSTSKLFYEVRVIWPDKSLHWTRVEGKVYYDEKGKAVRVLGTLLDTTAQKKAREEQRKLITLVKQSVDLMSILEMDGINSYINEAGKKLLGFENDEQVRSIPVSELHAPEDFDFVKKEVMPSVMTKGSWAGKMMVRHLKTGEIFPVYNNCIRIDDSITGKPICVGAVMRDLRPEIAAEQALANSEQLLRNITTASPTGLWMSDAHGAITYVNQTWIDWIGLASEENLGEAWLKSIIPEDHNKAKEKFFDGLTDGELPEVEFRINHQDGTVRWCVATGRPQFSTDGEFLGYIGACVDITEQKHLQRQKDDFIGIASHELKTPITSIKAYTQVLEKILKKKGETHEAAMINKMDVQLNRLTSLIGDLLDVTKINSGKLQFNNREFDFNVLVNEIVEELQRTTSKHRLVENLSPPVFVFGDKERIGQVITNLITNAIKYSPNSDNIIVSTEIKNNEVVLCVQDFGIGIAEKDLEKVFEQFYRVSGYMQHTFPGLGLGLYISSEIIKREGGRIWVTSEQGKGSEFLFALPLNRQDKK